MNKPLIAALAISVSSTALASQPKITPKEACIKYGETAVRMMKFRDEGISKNYMLEALKNDGQLITSMVENVYSYNIKENDNGYSFSYKNNNPKQLADYTYHLCMQTIIPKESFPEPKPTN